MGHRTVSKTDEQEKAVRERIKRLRERASGPRPDLAAVLKGILDLLADEL